MCLLNTYTTAPSVQSHDNNDYDFVLKVLNIWKILFKLYFFVVWWLLQNDCIWFSVRIYFVDQFQNVTPFPLDTLVGCNIKIAPSLCWISLSWHSAVADVPYLRPMLWPSFSLLKEVSDFLFLGWSVSGLLCLRSTLVLLRALSLSAVGPWSHNILRWHCSENWIYLKSLAMFWPILVFWFCQLHLRKYLFL